MYVNGLNFDFSIHDDEDICKKSKLLIQHLPKTPMQSMYADQVEKVFTTQRLKNYSAGFNHAEWWRTDWGRRTTCWVKNRCCPVPDRNWPAQWPPSSLLESRAEPTLKFYAFRLIIDIRVTLVSSYLTKKPGGHSLNLPPEIPNDHIMASSNSLVRSWLSDQST